MQRINKNFLTAIIEATPNAIYIKDEDGKYLMINEQGANSVGKKVEDFIGKDDKEVFPADLANKVRALDKKVFDGSAYNGEEAVDEDTIFYSYKFIIEDPETGERVLAGISTDISKFKKTERELFDARLKAEEASKHKSLFLQNMSHELRTPLNAIIGFSSILSGEGGAKNDMFDQNFEEYAKLINSSGKHLLAIINDLLDLSKIEAGEQDFNENEIDVAYEVESCIQTLRTIAMQNNIVIKEEIPEDEIIMQGDERILRQIVYNLLSNSIKYSLSDGEVKVKLSYRNSGGLDIAIIDEGIGMSRDDLNKAMIPFRRAAQVKENEITGTGLGLPIAEAFVKLFQGHLDIQSKLGIGTIATIHFPASRVVKD